MNQNVIIRESLEIIGLVLCNLQEDSEISFIIL